jgi:hypothetical protein
MVMTKFVIIHKKVCYSLFWNGSNLENISNIWVYLVFCKHSFLMYDSIHTNFTEIINGNTENDTSVYWFGMEWSLHTCWILYGYTRSSMNVQHTCIQCILTWQKSFSAPTLVLYSTIHSTSSCSQMPCIVLSLIPVCNDQFSLSNWCTLLNTDLFEVYRWETAVNIL